VEEYRTGEAMTERYVRVFEELSTRIRMLTIETMESFGSGHIGGSMSIADLLGVLYGGVMRIDPKNPQWSGRDYLVCSKGHVGPVIYSALAILGYFDKEMLFTLNQKGTCLPSHCDRTKTPGIDMTTGSLGQGFSVAAGIAFGNKIDGKENRCFVIVGDGESQEGQIWEAMMFAAHNRLDNLLLFIDNNTKQLDGDLAEVNNITNYSERLRSFGWNSTDIDGHDVGQIYDAIVSSIENKGKPSAVVLHTKKGHGALYAEGGRFNHNIPVSHEEARRSIEYLQTKLSGEN
jgi:transketolase